MPVSITVRLLFYSALVLFPSLLTAQSNNVSELINKQISSQQEAITSQQSINRLDTETQQLLQEYRHLLSELDALQTNNTKLQHQLNQQQESILNKQNELAQVQISQQQIYPHILRMHEVLIQFIHLDIPFLTEERHNRVEQLQQLMSDPSLGIGEKYRRLIEAYRVEAEYGHHIEAYSGQVKKGAKSLSVEFLRLGRIGFYYLSLDGSYAAAWDKSQKQWTKLDKSQLPAVKQAIQVAKKIVPPELLRLPLHAPEVH